MRRARAFLIRLAGLLGWRRDDREFDAELAAHLEMHVEDNLRLGMTPDEARRVALARLGGLSSVQQQYREQASVPIVEHVIQDVRSAVRALIHSRGYASLALLTIGLGVAGPTLMFAMAKQWILDPLPFSRPHELVDLRHLDRQFGNTGPISAADFLDWRRSLTAFEGLAAYRLSEVRLTEDRRAERVRGAQVTTNFFAVLGVQPAAGRRFDARDEDPNAKLVIISDTMRRRHFESADASSVVGRVVRLEGDDYVIAGVLPGSFQFTLLGGVDVWRPLVLAAAEAANRRQRTMVALGRLREGRAIGDARAELIGLMERLSAAYPETNSQRGVRVLSLADEVRLHHDAGVVIPVLFAMMCLVLLIACVNVSNVMLARASTRRQEMAVRLALGASRGRIVRQWLVEHLLLFLLAAAIGVGLAAYGASWVSQSIPAENRQFLRNFGVLTIDGVVVTFAIAVALTCGLMFGVMPGLMSTHRDVHSDLRDASARSTSGTIGSRVRGGLVISEVALALALLISAGLLVATARNITTVEVGFSRDPMVTFRLSLDAQQYRTPEDTRAFYDRLLPALERLTGVSAAGAATLVPFGPEGRATEFFIDDQPALPASDTPRAALSEITAGYSTTLGLRLRAGRLLSAADDANTPKTAMVNETFARRHFADANPIGRRLRLDRSSPLTWEIVGLVGDVKNYETIERSEPQIYIPFSQRPAREATVVLRTSEPIDALAPRIRAAVAAVDPAEPIIDLVTMSDRVRRVTAPFEIVSRFVSFFGAVTLLLAGVGVYGVVSYSFARRTREIGIRMALGARRSDVAAMVLRQLRVFVVAGVVPGLAIAWLLGQAMQLILFGVTPTDWRLYLSAILLLMLVGLIATLVPMRRAATIDPTVALRYE